MKGVGRNPKGDGKKKGGLKVHMLIDVHAEMREEKKEKTLCLRFVYYKDEKGRKYKFITNNREISAEEVALIYQHRRTIELTFKKLKQNFQLHFFYSETENGIKTQVWCTLIAHLLLGVIKAVSKSEKAFSTIAAPVRIHLTSIQQHRFLQRIFKRNQKTPNSSR
ncbi:MAG: transposase [Dysgonamonadaceae bacterium]|jgi:hypothetical protein|nr:transposase [Dysgonamonadaceae bacterium]